MTVYERFGTPAQQHEADTLQARIDAAVYGADEARLVVLRRMADAAERRVTIIAELSVESRMERAQAVMDWAQQRWPETEATYQARRHELTKTAQAPVTARQAPG